MIHTWANNYLQHNRHNVEPINIFLSASGGVRKSHLVKVIYKFISKILLYHCKDPENFRLILFEPTRISAVNIVVRITIYSGLGIKPESNDLI